MVVFADRTAAETDPESRYERLVSLPPSAKLVYKVLEHESPLTQTELRDRSLLSPRTTRDALSRLETADLVRKRVYLPDARRRLYAARSVAAPE